MRRVRGTRLHTTDDRRVGGRGRDGRRARRDRVARVACERLRSMSTCCRRDGVPIATTSSRAKSRVPASIEWIDAAAARGLRTRDRVEFRARVGRAAPSAASDCGIASRTSRVTAQVLRRNRRPTRISKRARDSVSRRPTRSRSKTRRTGSTRRAPRGLARASRYRTRSPAQMDLSAADLVITSLAECSLADVLARFGA